jgi:hypothetical protein
MGEPVARSLYRWLLRIHPPAFRREFADEMLWIFDQVSARQSTLPLFADAATSLARQWVLRGDWRKLPAGDAVPVAAVGSFAWEHIRVAEAPLPVSRVLQGSAVAVVFMAALAFAAFRPGPNDLLAGTATGGAGTETPGHANGSSGVPAAGQIPGHEGRNSQSGAPAGAQSQNGGTAAEQQFNAWLWEFDGGDRAKFQAFLDENYPEQAKQVDGMMRFRSMTGGFELKKTEKAEGTKFSGILKERDSDQFARFEIEVEAAEPHRITRLDLNAIPTPAEFALPRMSEEQAIAALRSEIERRVAADTFAGAVMVTKNGKAIFSGSYGLADREKKTKNQLSTKFRIGSMNKMITAVATLQLVQSGKIKLTAPLGEY